LLGILDHLGEGAFVQHRYKGFCIFEGESQIGFVERGQEFIIDISTSFPTLALKQLGPARAKSMRILWIKECCQKARWG
jgi:hypothetical protein